MGSTIWILALQKVLSKVIEGTRPRLYMPFLTTWRMVIFGLTNSSSFDSFNLDLITPLYWGIFKLPLDMIIPSQTTFIEIVIDRDHSQNISNMLIPYFHQFIQPLPSNFTKNLLLIIVSSLSFIVFLFLTHFRFNWGANMQKKSERLLNLLQGGEILKEARYKALKVTKEIKGFGNLMTSPSSSSSSSESSRTSSFGSYTNSTCNESDVPIKSERHPISGNVNEKNTVHGGLPSEKLGTCLTNGKNNVGLHLWDSPIKESGSLVDSEEGNEGPNGFLSGICSRLGVSSPSKYEGSGVIIRSFSDVGKAMKKKIDRQFSLRY